LNGHSASIVEVYQKVDIVENGPPLHLIDALQRNDAPVAPPPGPTPNADPIRV
jgi:hypothetical protein